MDKAGARSRKEELKVATHIVRTLSRTGENGAGYAEVVLRKCQVVGCKTIILRETRRTGRNEVVAAGYRV